MKKIVFALLLLSSGALHAQTLYQVEIVVFARESAEAENEENWNRRHDLRYPTQTLTLPAGDGSNTPYQLLPAAAMQLNQETTTIEQRRNMRVLAHMAWIQPVDAPTHAKAILVQGGKQFGAHHELEGTFALGVEHFLHVDANLWLSRFAQDSIAGAQELPLPPGGDATAAGQFIPTQIVALQEQRRMRSGELHYFDHPKMGLLVLVTKKTETP